MKRTVIWGALLCLAFAASCGGGGGGDSVTLVERLAFVTSTIGTGDMSSWDEVSGTMFTGLAAADAVCQARADSAGLSGTFVAWLSDSSDDAYCRAHGLTGKKDALCGQATLPATAGPWTRMDGLPFLGRLDLALGSSGAVYAPVLYDELGAAFDPNTARYWAGTMMETGKAAPNTCADWTDEGDVDGAYIGEASRTTLNWTFVSTGSCAQTFHLLCLEVGENNLMPDYAVSGKKVFVTSENGSGNLGSWDSAGGQTGIDAGNAVCQSLAAAAGLAHASSFRAWLSDAGTDAGDRLTSDGPWVRVDGMLVAESKSALINSILSTSINMDEDGNFHKDVAFTGTLAGGVKSDYLCSNWTSDSASVQGTKGSVNSIDGTTWTVYGAESACSSSWPIYCFED